MPRAADAPTPVPDAAASTPLPRADEEQPSPHSRERLTAALEASQLGAFALDPATLEGEWDARAAAILGATSWRGNLLHHAAAEEEEPLRRTFAAALGARPAAEALRLDFRLRAAGAGGPRWCALAGTLERSAGGAWVVGTLRDVTEPRLARQQREALERELRDANRRLARSEALLEALVEHAPIGIAFFDREFRFQRINPLMARMNGVPPAEHLGRTPRELLPELPLDGVEAAWRRVLATGEPITDYEICGRTPATGDELHYWHEAFYRVSAGGETVGVGVMAWDVTDEKRAEELQRLLMGVVGHDLRNPLSTVMNGLHILSAEPGLSERGRRVAERMRSGVARMERLVADLLDYTRVRTGMGIALHRVSTRLSEIVVPLVEDIRLAFPERRILCSGQGDDAGAWDPDRLRQVVANLVTNAIDYGAPSEPVEVRWRGEAEAAVLEVVNRGPVIPRELLPRLFEPMTRGDPSRRHGLGLGLFITREVARAHGGNASARSSVEQGTVFEVRLPRGA
jgi:PAS domain S-box-containing protein